MRNHKKVIFWLVIGLVAAIAHFLTVYFLGMGIWLIKSMLMFPIVLLVFIGLMSISAIVVSVFTIRNRKSLGRVTSACLFLSIFISLSWLWLPRVIDPFLLGYSSKIQKDVNLVDLQKWVQKEFESNPKAGVDLVSTLPADLRRFRIVSFIPAIEGVEPHFKFSTGGHFLGFWGLRVGNKSLNCPTSSHQRKIKPGIYSWRQFESEYSLEN